MLTSEADLQLQYGNMANIEKAAIGFFDDCLSEENDKARISEIINRLYSSAPRHILDYVGENPRPPVVAKFLRERGHLWRSNGEEIQAWPSFFRAAVVDLVASIVRNRNRAPLNEIFHLLQVHHRQALPYLPAPTSGSSLEAVKSFVLAFPKLFRLLNAEDGNEWTRVTPLGQIVVECVSVVVDGVILLGVSPRVNVGVSPALESKSAGVASTKIQGVAEVVRVTPAWGYLMSDTYGAIFFTSRACGGDNLQAKGLKLQLRVYFEASRSSDDSQLFNNVPVKWRASLVRQLTAAERDAGEGHLQSVSADSGLSATSAIMSVDQLTVAFSAAPGFARSPSPASSSASSQPKSDGMTFKRLPTSLAEWMKKRQETAGQNRTPTPGHSPSPSTGQRQNVPSEAGVSDLRSAMQAIEDELERSRAMEDRVQAIEDELEYNAGNGDVASTYDYDYEYDYYGNRYTDQTEGPLENVGIEHMYRNARADYVTNAAAETTAYRVKAGNQRANNHVEDFSGAAAEDYPECIDVGVQTDVTEEELLLRLLRTAPELLDLVRVVRQ